MRWLGFLGGIVLVLAGVVWILQGLDVAFAPRSFMSNQRIWAVYGSIVVVAGIWLAVWSWRRPS